MYITYIRSNNTYYGDYELIVLYIVSTYLDVPTIWIIWYHDKWLLWTNGQDSYNIYISEFQILL